MPPTMSEPTDSRPAPQQPAGDAMPRGSGLGWALALLLLGLVLYGCHALQHSRSGRAFVALRENPALAESIGVDVFT